MSAQVAANRGSQKLDLEDIKFVLENFYRQSLPEHGGIDKNRQIAKPTQQHQKRVQQVKKSSKQ
jgi:hypothetical protein